MNEIGIILVNHVDAGSICFAEAVEGKRTERWHDIYFIVNSMSRKVYIQSVSSISGEGKRRQEIMPLLRSGDSSQKIVITSGNSRMRIDEQGIMYVGVIPFLLNDIDKIM